MIYQKEFFETLKFIEEWFQKENLHTDYQNLLNQLSAYRQNANNPQARTIIVNFCNEINRKNKAFQFPKDWSYEKNECFLRIGASKFVGSETLKFDTLIQVVNNPPFNNATVFNEYVTYLTEYSTFRNKISQSISSINQIQSWGEVEINPQIGLEETGIKITFKSEVSVKHLSDMKKSSEEWIKIINAFYRLENISPEDIKILEVKQGSLILVLAAKAIVVKLIASGVKEVLETVKTAVELVKISKDVQNQENSGDETDLKEAERLINETAKKRLEKRGNEIADRLYAESAASKIPNNGDVRNAIADALDRIMSFSQKGGTLDFIPNKEDEKDAAQVQVFNDIQKIEIQIQSINVYLGHSKDDKA